MPISVEFLLDVSRHGDIYIPSAVIPIQRYSTIKASCPIFGEFVFALFQTRDQVFDVYLSDVLYTKIGNNQCERHWARFVVPESWCIFVFEVPVWFEFVALFLVGKDTSLQEAVYSFKHFDVYHTVNSVRDKVILVDYPLRE